MCDHSPATMCVVILVDMWPWSCHHEGSDARGHMVMAVPPWAW